MADILLMRRGAGLVPVNPSDAEALEKLPMGRELRGQITQMRNGKFHRRAFALLNLGFQSWTPETTVTKTERDTVVALGRFMCEHGLPAETAKFLCKSFMEKLKAERDHIEVDKSFDAYRDWVSVEAGYYRLVQTPVGIRREPISISFAAMDEVAFTSYYRAIFGVIWKFILSKTFKTEADAEQAVSQLLSFD